jgi:acetyl-CoA acetyltransferase
MLLMGAAEAGERIGRAPLARVVATGVHGVDPDVFGIARCRPPTGHSTERG